MTSTATRPTGPGGPDPRLSPDRPGEDVSGTARGVGGSALGLPRDAARAVMRTARSSPGKLSLIAIGLVALSLLTAVIGAVAVQGKQNTVSDLVYEREVLAASAQEVYRSLSDADATAASAFLSVGTEPPALRKQYEEDLARAGSALAKTATDSAGDAAGKVDTLSRQMPVYAGLVETARANNRQGFPVGTSYLREASELMRTQILPAAQELYRIDKDRLHEQQDDATSFPWLTTILTLGLLAALIAAQVYLRRRTNRVINVGLLVGSIATGVAILWGIVALTVQGVLVDSGRTDGTDPMDQAVRLRIATLEARADETLTLVSRGDDKGQYEEAFTKLAEEIGHSQRGGGNMAKLIDAAGSEIMGKHAQAAQADADAWFNAHDKVVTLNTDGDYESAVRLATDPTKNDSAATAFTKLDINLGNTIQDARQVFVDDTYGGYRALTLYSTGFALLMIVAAVGSTMGIRERLREYR